LRSADRHRNVPIPTLAAEPTEEALHAAGNRHRESKAATYGVAACFPPRPQGSEGYYMVGQVVLNLNMESVETLNPFSNLTWKEEQQSFS
jgi:hypothetical protein